MQSEYIAFNDPHYTDNPPYGNSVRIMHRADVAALYRRMYPNFKGTDGNAVDEFMVVHWAWNVPATLTIAKLLSPE